MHNTMTDLLQAHIDSHQTDGRDWPADAIYAVSYRHKTWPVGWDREYSTAFFSTGEELRSWYRKKLEWAREEDNGFEFDLYFWDLGPVLIFDTAPHLIN